MIKLSRMLLEERIRVVNELKDDNLFYDLLVKYLPFTEDELKIMYKIEGNYIKNTLTITGSSVNIYNLFDILSKLNIKFEMVSSGALRLDILNFLHSVR